VINFKCAKCGKEFKVEDSAGGKIGTCSRCGHRNKVPPPASEVVAYSSPPTAKPAPPPIEPILTVSHGTAQPLANQTVVVVERPQHRGNSLAIASVILAVVAFLFCWIPILGLISIPVAALGVLLGSFGCIMALFRRGAGVGFSLAGVCLSLFAIAITSAMTFAIGETAASVSKSLNESAVATNATNQLVVPADERQPAADAPPTSPNHLQTSDGAEVRHDEPNPQLPPEKQQPTERAPQQATPEWASARDAVQQGDVRVQVTTVRVDFALVKSLGSASKSKEKLLLIGLRMENLSDSKKIDFRGFAGDHFDFSSNSSASLKDNFENVYKRISFGGVADIEGQVNSASVYPGKPINDLLVFEPPIDKASSLRLELPASAFGGEGRLRIEIPADMIVR
jgi:DNA-directed RNA polymerase subunit RPC12/RpoP